MPVVQPTEPEACAGSRPARPKFHHRYTLDRLREGLGRPPSFSESGKTARRQKSVFREMGLDADELDGPCPGQQQSVTPP